MLFGHNTNVKVGEHIFHVQTEDRGAHNALLDTTVYCRGRVVHRLTNNYFDLLPLTADTEEALKLRLDDQHKTILEELRSGKLHLVAPPLPSVAKTGAGPERKSLPGASVSPVPTASLNPPLQLLHVELINAKTWISGKRALLQIAVRDQAAKAVEAAKVTARVDGAADLTAFSTVTGPFGHAQLEFDMPRLANPDAALVIEATHGTANGHLKFHLRAKPRVPSIG